MYTQTSDTVLADLLKDYQRGTGFDALFDHSDQLNPHWQPFLERFANMGSDKLERHLHEVQRLLYENGLTFSGRGANTKARNWKLDPLPYIIGSNDWHGLQKGVRQRARLLNALLKDLYGPRTVLEQGILPTQPLIESGGWWLACQDTIKDNSHSLFVAGLDIIRDSQGEWRVNSQLTQSLLGAGFALENRIVLARSLPRLYRDAPLQRLSGSISDAHTTLSRLGGKNRDDSTVVLLTAGPHSEGYLEHAYLASYLNIPLVEGQDLVVREQRVWIRTLGGLTPVDVILRRMNDAWCDPLELRSDSVIGVPGLMQAIRSQNVKVANPLGASILENPLLTPFWPKLCEFLLGEPLLLKGVDSWWCGEPEGLQHTLDAWPSITLVPLEDHHNTLCPQEMEPTDAATIKQRLLDSPEHFVAEALIQPSTSPVFEAMPDSDAAPRIQARPVSIRLFASLDANSIKDSSSMPDYRVMPGGLSWVGTPGTSVIDSSIVKDLWVLADKPQPHVSQMRSVEAPLVVTRDGSDLPSRVADGLFWFGRYGERLDARVRLIREALVRLLEQDQLNVVDHSLNSLLRMLCPELIKREEPRERFNEIRQYLMGQLNATSLDGLSSIAQAIKHNAQAARDHLGDDAWRLTNSLGDQLIQSRNAVAGRRACEHTVTELAAIFGLCNETMPHHYGWRLMDIGRFIERCQNTLLLLENALITCPPEETESAGEMVLALTDTFSAYRRRYRSALHPNALLDLLLFDEGNPRSVGYMFKRMHRQLDRLPNQQGTPYRSKEQQLIIEASSHLQLCDVSVLSMLPASDEAKFTLKSLLEEVSEPLGELTDAISHSHFVHIEVPRHMLGMKSR